MTQTDIDAAANAQIYQQQMLSRPFGGTGVRFVTGTTPQTGLTAYLIVPTADAVFASVTPATGQTVTNMTGITHPAGIPIGVRLTAFTLTSGSVQVYEL